MADKNRMYFVIFSMAIIALALASCTDVQTLELEPEYKPAYGYEDYLPEKNLTHLVEQKTEEIIKADPSAAKDTPLSVSDRSLVYIDPESLVRKLCPEQVLLGLRGCEALDDGKLNITIINVGFRNITMIFYMYYHDELMGYYYDEYPFITKEEKTFTIEFKDIEEKLGEITKIEATPVLLEGLEALSCENKKLPVMVRSSCR